MKATATATMTLEERKAEALRFIAQKRESLATAILVSMCGNRNISHDPKPLVREAIGLADALIEELYCSLGE